MVKNTGIHFVAKYKVEGVENYATLKDCINYIKKHKILGIDIETSKKFKQGTYDETIYQGGLDPYLTNVVMLQIGTVVKQFVIDVRDFTNKQMKEITDFLNYNNDILLVAHNCLPTSTDVLTKEGWKNIENITKSDIVYGYNEDNITTQPINSIIKKKDEVIELYNKQRSLSSTKKHRWLVKERNGKITYKKTEELSNTRNQIILNGSSFKEGKGVPLTDNELRIFTWSFTDGIIKWYKENVSNIEITQSLKNKGNVDEIRFILNELGYKITEYVVKHKDYQDCIRFDIRAKISRELLGKINYKNQFNFCEFVLNLSEHQLDIFIDTYWKAEGFKKGKTDLQKLIFAQISKGYTNDTRNAISLALYRKGYTIGANTTTIRAKKRKIADCRTLQTKNHGLQDVFCLNVPLSNFIIKQNDKIFITGNCKFEGKHLKHKYGIRFKNVWDTMLCEINLTNGLPFRYGLANLAERYLGVKKDNELSLFDDLYSKKKITLNDRYLAENEHILTPFEVEDNFYVDKSTRLQFINIGKKPFTKEQILYGADDITMPLLIRERQLLGRKLPDGEIYNPTICHKIENSFSQVLADIELEGLGFDKEKWTELAEVNEKTYFQRKKELEEYVIALYPLHTALPNLFNSEPDCLIEWSSSKQVIGFFKKLEVCPQEMSKQTKRIEYTVGATAFLKILPNKLKGNYSKDRWLGFERDEKGKFIEDNDSLILAYLLLKKSEQSMTTFGKDWLKYVHPITGRIHSNYRQILNTSRMSSTKPNLQNLPGGKFRDCFIAKKGNKMLNADYSAQEIRIVADSTQDVAFVDFFLSGDATFGSDFHSYTATKMYRIMEENPDLIVPPKDLIDENGEEYHNPAFTDEDNKKRNNAKAINFKINYGGSAYTLKDDFGVSEEVAQQFIDTYMAAFPSLEESFKKAKRRAVEDGFVMIDKFSDRRWFCPYHSEMEELNDEIRDYYPDGYFEGAFRGESKDAVKKELYETYPFIKDMWRDYFRMHGKLERNGLNYPVQGKASMMVKLSMNMLRHKLISENITTFLLTNLVHDEALAEGREDVAKEMGKLLSEAMVKGGEYFCKTIPMSAVAVISDVWEH